MTTYALKIPKELTKDPLTRYVKYYDIPGMFYTTTPFPASAYPFSTWTQAQLVAFRLGIDCITEVIAQ